MQTKLLVTCCVSLVLLSSTALWAQPGVVPATIVFSMTGIPVANSAAGGSNEAAVFNDDDLLIVFPDPFAPFFADPIVTQANFNAYFGDEDNDGDFGDAIVGQTDAVHIPSSAPQPPTMFDVFVSFSVDTDPDGIMGPVNAGSIDDGDVVRLLPRGGFVPFITRVQAADSMGTSGTTIDINGFAVDESTGDLYWTMTATQTVNGVSVLDSGIVRLPAASYVANPDGTVLSVVSGGAEIVLTAAEVDAFFLNAGLPATTDIVALSLDPLGGVFMNASGQLVPNLLMADENNSPTIVTTQAGGVILSINFQTFNNGPALGLQAVDLFGGPLGELSALSVAINLLTERPRVIDTFPVNFTTPGPLTIDVSGATPNSTFVLFAKTGDSTPGLFTYRWSLFLSMLDGLLLNPGGISELYINDTTDPLFLSSLLLPQLTTDAEGYASISFTVGALPPGLAICFQGVDPNNLALSTAIVPVAQ